MFSYEHLASFCATVEEGSYSQAAKKLGKDRTTVREQVKALEDSYAVTLFVIQGKKAVASEEGEAMYRQAKLLVRNSEQLNVRMMNSYRTEYTHFNIYHDILVPNALILHIEHYLAKEFPHIRVHWLHRNRQEALNEVSTNKNSLAIMQNRLDSNPESTYEFMHLGTDQLAVFCNPSHPLTSIENLTAGDLQLTKQYVSENHLHSLPDVFSISTEQHVVSNNDVLLSLLMHDGWAFVSRDLAETFVESGKLVELRPAEISASLKVGLSFYFPTAMKHAPELLGLHATLRAYARDNMS
ncbi:LysR family transcriptional regulator [Vibrio maerlii]|uniref:LysR family transcriptional regulator n=1 Tax=Vibrio maerlii TaxID=2231648 RepID=UPI000E3CD0A0|nr:LysR family transcriptional regulator [Vibrio maerlii]